MDAATFVLFGSTGDLAKRKIFPALFNLFVEKRLPIAFSIIALGRKPFTDVEFRSYVEKSLYDFSRNNPEDHPDLLLFLHTFRYFQMDATNEADYQELLQLIQSREQELNIPENRMFYLSVAPEYFYSIAYNIRKCGMGTTKGWKRLVIEKPFGHDLQSARELNEKLSESFEEHEIYRIDHYLGKPMVQNLGTIISRNPVLKSIWNHNYIANIQITASETVGVEERAGYYEGIGAVRDMFQNHMLQLLLISAMHVPKMKTAATVRDQKIEILKSIRPLSKNNVIKDVIRGQYGVGLMGNQVVAAYRKESRVDAASMTDTFVAARVWIDNPYWKDVPIYIRTGKRMKQKLTTIIIEFKNLEDNKKKDDLSPAPNLLAIQISPEEKITLQLNGRSLDNNGELEPFVMHYTSAADSISEAYELLIMDAWKGDATFFAHWEEVELAWKWVQPIVEAFDENRLPLHFYSSGSSGPEAAHHLLREQGFVWWPSEPTPSLRKQFVTTIVE